MAVTISDLKNQLNGGSRTNKFLIEIPVNNIDNSKLNILCKSASLPQRNISTTEIWKMGRKYNVRAETEYPGTYDVTFIDDKNLSIRKAIDQWMIIVDDSRQESQGIFSSSSYEDGFGQVFGAIQQGIDIVNGIDTFINGNPSLSDTVIGMYNPNMQIAHAKYQKDINIWQLSPTGNKVYGYKLQNAFPSSIGEVQYDDSDLDNVVQYNVTFTYSEFIILNNKELEETLLGDDLTQIINGRPTNPI